ncbi:MAG: DUF3232 domain-containing protein [Patescibacteria group bacterium]
MEDLKYFRDANKYPDLYPEEVSRRELKEEIKEYQENKATSEAGGKIIEQQEIHSSIAANFEEVLGSIAVFKLKDEFKNDLAELEILHNRKVAILKFLHNIVDDVNNYVNHINNMSSQKESLDDGEKYRAVMGSSDAARRNYHNRLISDIKLAVRQININFNKDFPEELRIKEEKKYSDRKGFSDQEIASALAKKEYITFSNKQGIFIDLKNMPKDPQGERKYIMNWAFDFYADLARLQKDLETEIKKETL